MGSVTPAATKCKTYRLTFKGGKNHGQRQNSSQRAVPSSDWLRLLLIQTLGLLLVQDNAAPAPYMQLVRMFDGQTVCALSQGLCLNDQYIMTLGEELVICSPHTTHIIVISCGQPQKSPYFLPYLNQNCFIWTGWMWWRCLMFRQFVLWVEGCV